ncbi:MAG: hypothetical protein AAFR93_10905, partial [Pseudomonadota bacterium]
GFAGSTNRTLVGDGTSPPGVPVTVDVLANDTGGDVPSPTSVLLVDPANPSGPGVSSLTVPGQGTWSVNPTSGEITFTPTGGFTGDPTPQEYTVEDAQGNVSPPATVTLDYTPVATDDIAQPSGAVTDPVVVDVLANDTTGDDAVPGSVSLVPPSGATNIVTAPDPTNPSGPPIVTGVTVPGEGTWTTDPSGTVTFTPDPSFGGGTPTVGYTIADDEGNRSPVAEVIITYSSGNPLEELENTKQPLPGNTISYLDDLLDPEPYEPTLIVDVIIRQTASNVYDLNGTRSLDTGVNTRLGVEHPILAAVNSLTSLQGIDPLASGSLSNVEFNGIPNYETIGRTLANIGFRPIFDPLATNDGADEYRLRNLLGVEDLRAEVPTDTAMTFGPSGRQVAFEGVFYPHGVTVMRAGVMVLGGQEVSVASMTLMPQGEGQTIEALPGKDALVVKGSSEDPARFDFIVTTDSGDVLAGVLTINPGTHDIDATLQDAQARLGFSQHAEQVASASTVEQARLLHAINHGDA